MEQSTDFRFRLSPAHREKLEQLAEVEGCSQAELIRRWIDWTWEARQQPRLYAEGQVVECDLADKRPGTVVGFIGSPLRVSKGD